MNGLPPAGRFVRGVLASVSGGAGILAASAAFAQSEVIRTSSSPFTSANNGADVAQAWIGYLFHGENLPDIIAPYAAPLSAAAEGLRQGLGLYSMGMLIFAALLVFYHIAVMVVETAHYGVPMGKRSNQIWMPIRFVLALGLLVPVSSSLSSGQYLVLKIAEEGSTMASNVWRQVANTASGHLSGLVTPRSPNAAQLVAAAVEMESCRMVYEQIYTPLETDPVIHLAGNTGSVVKLPPDRFVNETWRYTNALNYAVPLCGEFRFSGYRPPLASAGSPPDAISRLAENVAEFSHSQTDSLISEAHMIAGRVAPGFMETPPASADIREDLSGLIKSYRGAFETKQQSMVVAGGEIAQQALVDSADAGWLTAASFIPELVHLQESYGEIISHALPDAQEPVFAHPEMTHDVLRERFNLLPISSALDRVDFEKLFDFYTRVSNVVAQIHGWLYTNQLPDKAFVAPSSGDLRDHLNAATEPTAIFSFYARALDASAMAHGVWGEEPDSADGGYPFARIPYGAVYNPFTALVEYGRRQTELASALAGLAGSGISTAGATGPAALLFMASAGFFTGGAALIFIIPLLPFLRFLMGVLSWALALFEGIVAMPLVALAHLTPGGEGLSGGMARQAYLLWFGLMVRPLLTLFGLVLGLLLFALGVAFINAVLSPFAHLALSSNTGLLVVANTGLVFLYDVLVFGVANASFKGIHWLPDRALRWLTSMTVSDTGDVASPNAGAIAGPSGSSSVTAFLAPNSVSSSVTASSFGSMGSPEAQSHAMKVALFPAYGDGGGAGVASTSYSSNLVSSNTSVAGNMGGAGGGNVSVTATSLSSSSSGSGGTKKIYTGKESKGDRNPFKQEKHNASMGGKDRSGNDEGIAPPPGTPSKDTPKG